MSIAGGLDRMAERARVFGCETVQVFSRSPRGGQPRALATDEIQRARQLLLLADIDPVVVHMPYFANLCAPRADLRDYAVRTLAEELGRTAALGSSYLVTHLGRPGEVADKAGALARVEESILAAFAGAPPGSDTVMLLLENTAGGDEELGSSLTELAGVFGRLSEKLPGRVGLCLDTCHAHAAGYDLGAARGAAELARIVEDSFGPRALKVVHANDALGESGSGKDRHAPVGEGTIGARGFSALMAEPLFSACPFIVETPGSDEERARDLARLKTIRAGGPG